MREYKECEKVDKAKKYKIEGNDLFGKELFPAAIKKYNKALEWINYVDGDANGDKTKVHIDVNNNISLIWMRRGYYENVIRYAEKVLSFDEENVKALSRCAAAKIKQNKYIDARIDLKKAKSIDPNNGYVKKLLHVATARIKKEKAQQKQQYQAMFGYRPEKAKKT